MGSATSKGYPYPVGTDRVMDGDNAIQALAEALDADSAQLTRANPTGQSLTAGASNAIQWNAATQNGAALTKTSATVWTVTRAGLYLITQTIGNSAYATMGQRAHCQLTAGIDNVRTIYTGENICTCSGVFLLAVGDTISGTCFPVGATTINAGWLNVARLGRA